jgi:hypothetical protein
LILGRLLLLPVACRESNLKAYFWAMAIIDLASGGILPSLLKLTDLKPASVNN